MSTEHIIVEGILRNGVEILEHCVADSQVIEKYISKVNSEHLNYPIPKSTIDITRWFMPDEYQQMDIEGFLIDQCPKENYDRLAIELQEYRQRDLLPLLRQMKYIVDTLRQNNTVWGVGRGSSVASYVLFLLGVHNVDSIKYKLPLEEFFKGEKHG